MIKIRTIAFSVWLEMIRRKDVYVLLILLGALLLMLVSLDIFGLGGVTQYVKDIGLLAAWICGWILSLHMGARELPQEEERGTIYPMLAKPITRFEFLIGKWLGIWTVVCAATALFYALVAGVVAMRGGAFPLTSFLQAMLLHGTALGVMASIALAFSTRLNRDAAASLSFVLTGACFLIVPRIPEFIAGETAFRAGLLLFLYHLLPHFEVFDLRDRLVYNHGPAAWNMVGGAVLYGLLMTTMFLFIAWLAYRHKKFSRGNRAE